MHFYTKHIGDFNAATRHLTRIERSIYSDMIELYYDTEKPLITDVEKLCRLIAAHSEEEKKAVQNVLADFFILTDEGWFNKRCDEEIQRIYSKSEKARQSAKSRWDNVNNANALQTHSNRNANFESHSKSGGKSSKKSKNDDSDYVKYDEKSDKFTDKSVKNKSDEDSNVAEFNDSEHYQNANAMQSHSEGNAFGMLPINPLTQYKTPNPLTSFEDAPLTTEKPQSAGKKPVDPETIPPYTEIQKLYNEICGAAGLQKCHVMTDARKKNLKARWNSKNSKGEHSRRSVDWWRRFFELVAASDFLTGRVSNKSGNWKANFDFCVTESSFVKICEGSYSNGAA